MPSSKFAGRLLLITLVAISLLVYSCGIYLQTLEFKRFAHSRFVVGNMQMLSISGIDVSQKHSMADLDFQEMIGLGKHFLTGKLPSRMQIYIDAFNPFDKRAYVAGMDWLLMMKQDTLASGQVKQPLQIPALGRTTFPLVVTFNLARLIQSGSLDKMLPLVLNSSNREAELRQLGVHLKIRPYYLQKNKVRKYPGYISVRLK